MNKKLSRALSTILAFAMIVSCLTVVNVTSVFAASQVTEQWDATNDGTSYPEWLTVNNGSIDTVSKSASGTMAENIFNGDTENTIASRSALVTSSSSAASVTVSVTGDATLKLYAIRNSSSGSYFKSSASSITNGTVSNITIGNSSTGTAISGYSDPNVEAFNITLTATNASEVSTYGFGFGNSSICIFRMELTYTSETASPTSDEYTWQVEIPEGLSATASEFTFGSNPTSTCSNTLEYTGSTYKAEIPDTLTDALSYVESVKGDELEDGTGWYAYTVTVTLQADWFKELTGSASVSTTGITFTGDGGKLTTDTTADVYAKSSGDSSTNYVSLTDGYATLVNNGSKNTYLYANLPTGVKDLTSGKVTFSGTINNFESASKFGLIDFSNGTNTIAEIRTSPSATGSSDAANSDDTTNYAAGKFSLAVYNSTNESGTVLFDYYSTGVDTAAVTTAKSYSITFDYSNDTISLTFDGANEVTASVTDLSTVTTIRPGTRSSTGSSLTVSNIAITVESDSSGGTTGATTGFEYVAFLYDYEAAEDNTIYVVGRIGKQAIANCQLVGFSLGGSDGYASKYYAVSEVSGNTGTTTDPNGVNNPVSTTVYESVEVTLKDSTNEDVTYTFDDSNYYYICFSFDNDYATGDNGVGLQHSGAVYVYPFSIDLDNAYTVPTSYDGYNDETTYEYKTSSMLKKLSEDTVYYYVNGYPAE